MKPSRRNQGPADKRPRLFSAWRPLLVGNLAAYLALATAFSICQTGYFNADFVGYATIAHRLLRNPQTAISGYWSPLYSWCMAPLIHFGIDDLTAGRVVLVTGGTIYLLAVFGVVCRSHVADERRNRMITAAVMAVAVLQAATWVTRMMDPDLLADGLLFCYFYVVLDPLLPQKPWRALPGGIAAGLAYLGKGYMLPFTLVHLPATLLLRWWIARRSEKTGPGLRRWAVTWIAFLVGQAVVAGPWIAVLTSHYGHLTFSTAGAANHANMGPGAFGNDPLWNPGIAADFIADPHFAPDWSPLQDSEHFLQQLKVLVYNANSCIPFLLPWAALGGIFAVVARIRRRRFTEQAVPHDGFPGLGWCALTVFLYCGGYCLINLESRYIVPVTAPLLCLGAMRIVSGVFCSLGTRTEETRPRWRRSAWWLVPIVLLVSLPDLHRLAIIPLKHPQSVGLARFRRIAEQLHDARVLPNPFACSRWHNGMNLSYAAGDVANYLGSPLPDAATSMIEQLQESGATVYLRWRQPDDKSIPHSAVDAFDPAAIPTSPWKLDMIIKDSQPPSTTIEVYARAKHKPKLR